MKTTVSKDSFLTRQSLLVKPVQNSSNLGPFRKYTTSYKTNVAKLAKISSSVKLFLGKKQLFFGEKTIEKLSDRNQNLLSIKIQSP